MAMISIGIEITIRAANRLLWLSKWFLTDPTTPPMRQNVPPVSKNHIVILLRKLEGGVSRGTLLIAIIVKNIARKITPRTVTIPKSLE